MHLAEKVRQRPLDIDGREIGHVGGDQRGPGMALAVADRGPRQIIGVLALDQVGLEALERRADRAVAQQQPVIGASGHVGRGDRHGDRAPVLDHLVRAPGNDQQMAGGATARIWRACAADRCGRRRRAPTSSGSGRRKASACRGQARDRRGSCASNLLAESAFSAMARNRVGNFTHSPCFFAISEKWQKLPFSNWHAHCYIMASTWFHNQRRGGSKRFLVPLHRPFSFGLLAAPSSCFSSPLSNISIMMSDPPTNSPFT